MEPFLGMIVQFGGNFAPRGWALCDGQLLSISANQALFSILGTTYGGDGRTTFGLPDLRGRVAIHPGQGPGLSPLALGQSGGVENVTLTVANMPSHNHQFSASRKVGTQGDPTNAVLPTFTAPKGGTALDYNTSPADTAMNDAVINHVGGSQSFGVTQPYQCVNFIIALQGLFPSRG